MTITAWPISIVVGAVDHARDHRCPTDHYWWSDWHRAPRGPRRIPHHAQDIFAPRRSLVLAPVAGTIADVGDTPHGGHSVHIHGDDGRTYYLAHLDAPPVVTQGQAVEAGQQVGLVGRSGNAAATCPHLHLAAHVGRGHDRRAVQLAAELRAVEPHRARHPAPPAQPDPTRPPCQCACGDATGDGR